MPALVRQAEYARLTKAIHTYGCCVCQTRHTEGDTLYAAHLHRAAKHHDSYRQPTPAEVLRRLTEGDDR